METWYQSFAINQGPTKWNLWDILEKREQWKYPFNLGTLEKGKTPFFFLTGNSFSFFLNHFNSGLKKKKAP